MVGVPKILIANRGEIACRIIKTAKEMGFKTVAVYTNEDSNSLFVRQADEAFLIGSCQNYISIPKIIEAVKYTGAQLVHPGYGFLSENQEFVTQLIKHGIQFVGPNQNAMKTMGDKVESKKIASRVGVPCIPGYHGTIDTIEHALKLADEIGYPVILKALNGGGGKGMRMIASPNELKDSISITASEAFSSFGDASLMLEKYIDSPRHIEIQILGDKFGNVVYFPERECSIQRRNQKVIEESPSIFLDDSLRKELGSQAVKLAKSVGYDSAGTVEFLVDGDKNYYFLEMNTRLQVEHPVTEYVTGIDFVKEMIEIAKGNPISFQQSDIQVKGWSIESRIYAEDSNLFIPSAGTLTKYQEPTVIDGVRIDSGVVQGSDVSMYYDSMLCKLVTFGSNRNDAITKMNNALDQFIIRGVTHNIPILRDILGGSQFQKGYLSTQFLPKNYPNGFSQHILTDLEKLEILTISALLDYRINKWKKSWIPLTNSDETFAVANPSLSMISTRHYVKLNNELPILVTLQHLPLLSQATFKSHVLEVDSSWKLGDSLIDCNIHVTKYTNEVGVCKKSRDTISKRRTFQYIPKTHGFHVVAFGSEYPVSVLSPTQVKYNLNTPTKTILAVPQVSSPMPGTILELYVKENAFINKNDPICIIEAMKMQNVIKSPKSGLVKKVFVKKGQQIHADQILVEFNDF